MISYNTMNKRLNLSKQEINNSLIPIEKKPNWIKTKASINNNYININSLVKTHTLHTVCQSAKCPNIYECWGNNEATFLIGGNICTRRCNFCDIISSKPMQLDYKEPIKIAQNVKLLSLLYVTITGVARDDLYDNGSWLYAETVRQIKIQNPNVKVELLIPDFKGLKNALSYIFNSRPDVLGHNIETTAANYKKIRPGFQYNRSLKLIELARKFQLIVKSNIMLGIGESEKDILITMRDLLNSGCQLLTITQYLRPSIKHHPVTRWVHIEEFANLKKIALKMGFIDVQSGPLVRSSYKAYSMYKNALQYINTIN